MRVATVTAFMDRPAIHGGRLTGATAVLKIIGSPFRSFAEAEEACNIMLKNLTRED